MPDITSTGLWVGFLIFVVIALGIDTLIAERNPSAGPHASIRASLSWTMVWIACALIFNVVLWVYLRYTMNEVVAHQKALDFFAGYLIEKSLSVDNLFTFYLIFNQLHIPKQYQHRVFTYGIWSAIVFRLVIILFSTYLINRFHWILYLLGLFLIVTGIKMFFVRGKEDLDQSVILQWMKKTFRLDNELHGQRFFIKKNNLTYVTRLFIALILNEISDIIFAFDSIPAIFAITTDPFIVWTSNIFAILGLRSLYFLLATMAERFELLKHGIALILMFVGVKMVIEPWFAITTFYSLLVIASILVVFIILSMRYRVRQG